MIDRHERHIKARTDIFTDIWTEDMTLTSQNTVDSAIIVVNINSIVAIVPRSVYT